MIVFITIPWFSPAYKAGGPIQSIANLVENYTKDIEYRIFCSNVDLDDSVLDNIDTDRWIDYNINTKVFYATKEITTQKLSNELKKLQPTVLFITGLFSWKFNIYPLLFCKVQRKILSIRGMLHKGALSQKRFKKRIFLFFFKFLGIKNKIIFHATNEEEVLSVKEQFGSDVKIEIANNFPKKIIQNSVLYKKENVLKLITISLVSPMKNHLLVLKALIHCEGFIEYDIYGPIKDDHYWNECLVEIKNMPKNICVNYHGEISPALVPEKLNEHHVFIMPSKSENYAHSIVEALTMGKPVITSFATPWNNLFEKNAGMNVDTEVNSIINAISFFTNMNNDNYLQSSKSAVNYIEEQMDISKINKQYQKLFFSNT